MDKQKQLETDYAYGTESMKWYGWGSPVGLGLFFLSGAGVLWLLHLANIIK